MTSIFVLNNTDCQADVINWATNNIGPQSGNASVVETHGWYYNTNCNLGILTATVASAGTGTSAAGYAPGQVLTPSGGSAWTNGTIAVKSVTMGTCNVITGGNNYTVGDTLTWSFPSPGIPAVVTVATANATGAISTVTITAPGSMHNWGITNATAFNTQVTHNANCTTATFNSRWDIRNIAVASQGDYSSFPSNPVSFTTTGHGTGATANLSSWNKNAFICNALVDYNSFVTEWDWLTYGGGAPQ